MNDNNPIPGNTPGLPDFSKLSDDDQRKARLLELADWLKLPPPPITHDGGKMELSPALLGWCRSGGVSIDYVLTGSAKAMARSHKREFSDTISNFEDLAVRLERLAQLAALAGFELSDLPPENTHFRSRENDMGVALIWTIEELATRLHQDVMNLDRVSRLNFSGKPEWE